MAALLPTCVQLILLSLLASAAAGSSLPVSPAVCMPGMTPPFLLRQALPFCGGGTLGSATCCTFEHDAKLHQAFMDDLKNHDYYGHDPHCASAVKTIICAVCLPSASASAEPFSNTTASIIKDNSSLPLRCAALSPSIHDLTSPSTDQPATPEPEWLVADDNTAPTTPKWVIALIASVVSALATLFGFVTYKICKAKLECCNNNNNQCCSNIICCLC